MPVKGKNLGGRAYLVAQLQKRGLSRRGALRVLNFIFAEMKKQLQRGRAVEFPFGKLKRVKKRFGKYWDDYDDWPAHRQPYSVEWELDEAGERLLNGRGKGQPAKRPGARKRSVRTRKTGK
jgi:hypothetical protein